MGGSRLCRFCALKVTSLPQYGCETGYTLDMASPGKLSAQVYLGLHCVCNVIGKVQRLVVFCLLALENHPSSLAMYRE